MGRRRVIRRRSGRVTYEDGKRIVIPRGEHVYLGTQVRDYTPKGLSHSREVKAILREMEEDAKHLSPRTIQARCYALFMGILHSSKMPKTEKRKAIKMLNDFRKRHGWKPYELQIPL